MKPSFIWAVAALAAAGAVACGGEGDTTSSASPTTEVAPAKTESDALVFVREEEKLARDVYAALSAKDPLFPNIEASEQSHMDAVLVLLDRHGIADPAKGAPPGVFQDADLQKLYDRLVAEGSASTIAALQVGVEIEELDLHDIDGLRATTTKVDVLRTYDNLTRGSRNHLRAFYAHLLELGGSYVPRHLDPQTFAEIVGSPIEGGGPPF